MAEAPTKRTSTLEVELEPIYTGSEGNEDFESPLRLRSRRTRGPTMVMVEELSEEIAERQVTKDEPMSTWVPTKIAPSGSLQGQENSTNSKDILPESPIEMMPSTGSQSKVQPLDFSGLGSLLSEFFLPQYRLHH